VERWYEKVDVLMMPVFPTPAFHHGNTDLDTFQQKQADLYTSTANLVGHPALSVPSTLENGLPVGVQFMAPPFEEDRLFQVSALLEKEFQAPEAPGYLTVCISHLSVWKSIYISQRKQRLSAVVTPNMVMKRIPISVPSVWDFPVFSPH
jgi:hypothetical protein